MRRLLALLLLVGCALPPTEGGAVEVEAGAPSLERLNRLLHHEVNAAREDQGRRPFEWSEPLAEVARRHSSDMALRRYFDHISPDGETPTGRAEAQDIECRVQVDGTRTFRGVTENLHLSSRYRSYTDTVINGRMERSYDWFTPDEIAQRVVRGWLESPGHRRNLLDPSATAHGVGIALNGEGQLHITQVLC